MSPSEPRLIRDYLQVLAARLPASIVDELADGLAETHRSYLGRGLSPDAAAEAAVEEFGSPEEILAGFAALDTALIVGVTVWAGSLTWVTALAMAGSTLRVALCARALRPAMAG